MTSLLYVASYWRKPEPSVHTIANNWIPSFGPLTAHPCATPPDLRFAASGMTIKDRVQVTIHFVDSINWGVEFSKQKRNSWVLDNAAEPQLEKHQSFRRKPESSMHTIANNWIPSFGPLTAHPCATPPGLRFAASGMTIRNKRHFASSTFVSIDRRFELIKQKGVSWLFHHVIEPQAQKHPSFRRKPESSESSFTYAWIINLRCTATEITVEVAR